VKGRENTRSMETAILGDVLRDLSPYEADTIVYVPVDAEVDLFTPVRLVQHGAYDEAEVEGYRYLLEVGVMQEVLEGLEGQLSKKPTPPQSLRAVLYYAEHDAFPDISLIK
jgi:hypothetical protein